MSTAVGTMIIEAEDRTAAGLAKVEAQYAAMQARLDKRAAKGGGKKDAEYYKASWAAEEEAQTKKTAIAKQGAADRAKLLIATSTAEADATQKATHNFGAWGSASQRLTTGLQAVKASIGSIAIAGVGVGAAVQGFQAAVQGMLGWAAGADKARKATVGMQIDITGAREAVGGMVSDMDLAQMANKAFAMGVVKNGVAFQGLAKGVSAIALKLGEDVGYMMDSAITAIGRGSSLVLDNLGIILSQSEALDMYAAHIGTATSKMTEFEKSQAFAYAATKKIADAGREAAGEVDGAANSIMRATIAVENFKERGFGFNVNVGKIRDNLRGMAPEILALFGSRNQADIAKINRELDRQAELQAKQARELGDTAAKAADYRVTYEEVLAVADDLGHVEKMRGGQLDYENRIKREKQLNLLAKEALDYQDQEVKKAAAQAAIAAKEKKIADLRTQADSLDHLGKLLGEQKGKEVDIYNLQARALLLRKEAAQIEGDKTKQLEAQRAIELHLAQEKKLKKSSGGSGPSAAEKLSAENALILAQMQDQIRLTEVQGELQNTTNKSAVELAKQKLDVADAELEFEAQSLEITKTKNSVERTERASRLAQIERERELLGMQFQLEERKAANELIDAGIEKERKRALSLQADLSKEMQLRHKAASEQEAQENAAFALAQFHARTAGQRRALADAQRDTSHRQRLDQIEREKEAQEDSFNAREISLAYNDLDGARQLAHDREMARLDYEMKKRAEIQTQILTLQQAERARTQEIIGQVNDIAGGVQGFAQQVTGVVGAEVGRRREIEDAEFAAAQQRRTTNLENELAAFDRQIEANRGNAAAIKRIQQAKEIYERKQRAAIEKAEAKHQEKRKRQEMRAAGIQLLIQGAMEVGQAAAAFASFNFVQGALHTAAAALNIGYGVALMSGRIPVGGASSSAGAGAAGASDGPSGGDKQTSAASRIPESVPGHHLENQRPKGGSSGGTSVTIQNLYANGAVDRSTAENIGLALGKAQYSREGAY